MGRGSSSGRLRAPFTTGLNDGSQRERASRVGAPSMSRMLAVADARATAASSSGTGARVIPERYAARAHQSWTMSAMDPPLVVSVGRPTHTTRVSTLR